jgi:phosphopentomutase
MLVKTSELSGHALDYAVAKCEESHDGRLTIIRHEDIIGHPVERETEKYSYTYEWWSPSRIWSQGGLIIDREYISTNSSVDSPNWIAECNTGDFHNRQHGPTLLVAAMRCYVASRLGDTVDIPDELI